ncbi:NAD(P)-dependent oxidoreductase [Pseudomonas daroniae]|uniref:NAD(P)-dependent oxidoreductase n=1 Tax=Phytopseudomonas daroniae TaxID=2487519 RepID=A0A4Q9QRF7_9GAMM|nr:MULTISPECIES: NAD(P)-dependent oxidoreductase [Pseudomonas]TBU78448.1 NAD(P)-dependent oxidoreductase [Pseudomonas daroniae]TBU82876.1 NAD(P)-dependent oxidoreductase [Pseudomonas daroniae]TBU85924.1 NAD(P)-dependent oxidoreductase [Pseudomonas sp. FRB 228]TBU95087.1 NAD(P)-dependent oxidoreductase [Pseudomonas daroniae]
MTQTTVGFIGLGLMGQGMTSNLLNKGFALTIMAHRNRAPLEALVARGAVEVEDASAMARCSDLVLLCLPGSREVHAVLQGPRGLLAGLQPGQLVVDCSTGDPAQTPEIAALVREAGGRYMDAPVNRTPKEAAEGRLNGLAGGADADVEQARPVLQTFCETLHHLGAVGSGHKAKVIHNFIAQGNAAILAEAFCAAAKNGLELRAFADICRLSGGYSRTFERIIPFVLEGDDSGQKFALANCEKDMRYYTDLARSTPATGPVADAVYQTFMLAKALGHGDKYVPHLFDVLGEINGVRVRAHEESKA